MPTSPAEIFFNSLSSPASNPFEMVDALIQSGEDENDWREFKGASFLDAPLETGDQQKENRRRQDTIKQYWSESLSAFANSGGGLLIWGINTKGPRASNQSLAANAVTLGDRLEELKNEAVDPPVLGVKVLPVPQPDSSAGFVVCFIPDSSYSPHRAVFRNGGFYIRAGDSSRSMKTEVLRRMFYPHTFPRLIPIVVLNVARRNSEMLGIEVTVKLQNRGSASAQEAVIEFSASLPVESFPVSQLWAKRPMPTYGFICRQTIHPQEKIPFLTNASPRGEFPVNEMPNQLKYSFRILSLNAPGLQAEVVFDKADFSRAVAGSISKEATINMIDV